MRLDKYLAQANVGTRSQVKKLIRLGRIFVNGQKMQTPEYKVQEDDEVSLDGQRILLEENEYFLLNKPAGVVSATTDREYTTVVDLITVPHSRELFPVGRLDRDTEGLLLLTTDGALAHALLSPAKHVEKCYFVRVDGVITKEDVAAFLEGLAIGDKKLTKPAVLANLCFLDAQGNRIESDNEMHLAVKTELEITITEGRYHQVKRMFAKVGKKVIYLKRIRMGNLELGSDLPTGSFRKLTGEEIARLKASQKSGSSS